jgi:hypothetical protein
LLGGKAVALETRLVFPHVNTWGHSIDDLCHCFNELTVGQKIAISLEYTPFLTPPGVMMLTLTTLHISSRTNTPVRICNINQSLLSYLERVDFFNYDFVYTEETLHWWDRLARSSDSNKVIEIKRLQRPQEISSVVARSRDILMAWFRDAIYQEYRDNVANVLMEICGNSIEHSQMPGEDRECFFMLQMYSQGQIGISISIGDIGMGIRKHLEQAHNIERSSDTHYIRQALLGLSGRLDGTGGMGFQRVRQITDNYNGQLLVRSGKGVVKVENNKFSRYEFTSPFPGTQCAISLHPRFGKK